jgi:hypothetical protein
MSASRRRKRLANVDSLPIDRIDLDRLAEVVARMERGDQVPIDPAWLEGAPPLSAEQRGRLKNAFARNRELQPPLACMAPTDPPCDQPPIGSHSMQRGGSLSVLAEESQVMVLRYAQSFAEPAGTYIKPTPIRSASTFPGLCKVHDRLLFAPIDRHSLRNPTEEQLFLLAYRSVLRDFYVAREMAKRRQADLEAMLEEPTGGVPEMFVWSLLRIELVIPRLARLVDDFIRWHREGLQAGLRTIVGRNLPELPFATSNYIEPRYDEVGQAMDRSADPPPFVVLNVIPARDGSTVALSFLEQHRPALQSFLAPLKTSSSSQDFIDRVWRITLRYCDNVAIRPSAWRAIPERRQKRILKFAEDSRDPTFVRMLPRNISLIADE